MHIGWTEEISIIEHELGNQVFAFFTPHNSGLVMMEFLIDLKKPASKQYASIVEISNLPIKNTKNSG